MRLRIYYIDFRALMKEIRDRVESGEWSTWRIDNHINAKGQLIRRLYYHMAGLLIWLYSGF